MKSILNQNIKTYSGPILEKLYQEIYRNSGKYSEIGNYWEKGNKNEIDLVCIDELNKRLKIGEIKLNKSKANINILKQKSENFIKNYKDYEIEYLLLGLQDLDEILEKEGL